MMQVLPILKECHYMRRPSALKEVKLDDVENVEVSLFICLSLNFFRNQGLQVKTKTGSHHCFCISGLYEYNMG